jgi:cytochrome c biogenesis protein CcmG, thiol:disulfide interchange protein DsbE
VRRRAVPILVSLAGACLIGLLVYGVSAQPANRTLDQALAEGRRPPAPDAGRRLPALDGGETGGGDATGVRNSLAGYRGEVVLLNFWASWCTPCQAEAPLLEKAQERLRRERGTVLGVTYLDVAGDSREFVRAQHVTYPNLRDTNGEFAHSYGTNQLPESFVIDRAGDIVAICRGEIDQAFMSHTVALAQTGSWKPVPC